MMNNYMCVGRIVADPELRETETGKKVSSITVAVPRSYKNADGEYETDFIDCTLWNEVASSTSEYCRKGDMIGIKGRLESKVYEDSEGNKKKRMEVIADRVTFLSSAKQKEAEPEMAQGFNISMPKLQIGGMIYDKKY